ncbi:MAG: hypothetical protein CR993_07740 [Rhodobacterales bacterium]|nr:MAG: hypothetical protein CR993_07740 [Rhodobacterales bacterium]
MIKQTLAALAMSVAALPAMAEGWSINHLETMGSSEACMKKARSVLNRYMFAHGGGSTGADTWSLYGYDLEPGMQDVVIMCPYEGDMSFAIVVVQSESDSDTRSLVSQRLVDYWDEL